VSIAITAKERNALYGEIVVRLSGIDALYRALQDEDFEQAERLGREYCDYLLVILNDLGWGEVSPASARDFELTTAPTCYVVFLNDSTSRHPASSRPIRATPARRRQTKCSPNSP
jgi:hypothetical protein